MRIAVFILPIMLGGCIGATITGPDGFVYTPIKSGKYEIAAWKRVNNPTAPLHIYIEGDGHAFDATGRATANPTPHNKTLRKLAAQDNHPNVIYMARPCQFIMSDACNKIDWTTGRFSQNIVAAMSDAIRNLAENMPVTIIGYSGGALLSGIIIQQNPDINIRQWVTVAGVLNHTEWTQYFGDSPLTASCELTTLPNVPQTHYAAQRDTVVPNELSQKWTNGNLIIVPNATHAQFNNLNINFI